MIVYTWLGTLVSIVTGVLVVGLCVAYQLMHREGKTVWGAAMKCPHCRSWNVTVLTNRDGHGTWSCGECKNCGSYPS